MGGQIYNRRAPYKLFPANKILLINAVSATGLSVRNQLSICLRYFCTMAYI